MEPAPARQTAAGQPHPNGGLHPVGWVDQVVRRETFEAAHASVEFPGWHPWVSSGGRWWAARKGRQPADPPEWWAMTVDADDAEGLREAIARQEQLAHPVGAA